MKTLNEYQVEAMRFQPHTPELTNVALGLCGEAGEFAEHVKKVMFMGKELDRTHLVKELGDVMWYVALACEVLGVDLQDVADLNIAKLAARYPNGFVVGGGNREGVAK